MAAGEKKSVLMAAENGVPGGVATLNSAGKLVQVPSAIETGAALSADIENIDTVTYSGVFRVVGNAGTLPPGVDNGTGIVINGYWDANYGEQLYISFFADRMYRRRRKDGVWQRWKAVTEESLPES